MDGGWWLVPICAWLFIIIVIKPMVYERRRKQLLSRTHKITQDMGDITLSAEVGLLDPNKEPTDDDIQLYYKMYKKKWELDHKDQWITDHIKPMTFEEFEEGAKREKFLFLERMTCDMFVGFPPNTQMIRCNDYKAMVEAEERSK